MFTVLDHSFKTVEFSRNLILDHYSHEQFLSRVLSIKYDMTLQLHNLSYDLIWVNCLLSATLQTDPISGANSPKYEDMDGLEGEEGEEGEDSNIPEPNDEQPLQSDSLTAKLQEIIYDPKSYLLGDLTEESVYNDYKVIFLLSLIYYETCFVGSNEKLVMIKINVTTSSVSNTTPLLKFFTTNENITMTPSSRP